MMMIIGAGDVDPVVFDAPVGQPKLMALAVKLRTQLKMEAPFGWKKDIFITPNIQFFPDNVKPTISFTATPLFKILGYLPLIGTFIGISRIYRGVKERNFFNQTHLHDLSGRSVKWAIRGGIECVPVLGGIICLVMDIAFTIGKKSNEVLIFKDETACGHCHVCPGACKC
jgi:hypothetical protein